MRSRRIVSMLAALALGSGVMRAQAPQQPPTDNREAREKLIRMATDPATLSALESMRLLVEQTDAAKREREGAMCAGPGNQQVPLNAIDVFDGRTYRCVEVFEPDPARPGALKKRSVGLIRFTTGPPAAPQ